MAQLVEGLTGNRMVASLCLTASGVTVLFPQARHFIRCLVLVQPRKTGNCPDMTDFFLTRTLSIKAKTQWFISMDLISAL